MRLMKPPRKGGETGTVLTVLELAVGGSTAEAMLAMLQLRRYHAGRGSCFEQLSGASKAPTTAGSCTCKATEQTAGTLLLGSNAGAVRGSFA